MKRRLSTSLAGLCVLLAPTAQAQTASAQDMDARARAAAAAMTSMQRRMAFMCCGAASLRACSLTRNAGIPNVRGVIWAAIYCVMAVLYGF